jgi:hypothetical protein
MPRPLFHRETPGTHFIGGWVDTGVGLDRCEKSRPPPRFDPRTVQPLITTVSATTDLQFQGNFTWFYAPPKCHVIVASTYENKVIHFSVPFLSDFRRHAYLRTYFSATLVMSDPIHWTGARNFLKIISAYFTVGCLLYEAPHQSDTVPHRATWRYIAYCSVEARHTILSSRMASF